MEVTHPNCQKLYNILGRRVFIKFIIDQSLVGGVEFGFQGKHKDYSLASQIEDILNQEKKVINRKV